MKLKVFQIIFYDDYSLAPSHSPIDVKEIFIRSSFMLLRSLMRELKKKRDAKGSFAVHVTGCY